jgi:branched-chain amino acid transport system permease protein
VASGVGLGAVYGMSAVGLVVLYRASGTLNFSFGALGAAAAHCTWTLINYEILPVWAAWVAGILVSTLLSFLYGRYISSRLIDRSRSIRAIATLGFALLILGIVTTIWGPGLPRRLSLPSDLQNVFIFSVKINYTRLAGIAFALLSVIGMALLLNRTRIGLAMRALASNRSISGLIGINVAAVDSVAWLISGAFDGIAGLLLADLLVMSPIPLTFLVIPAIAAAVFGGLTSMTGAFIGGVIGGFAEALLTGVPSVMTMRSAAPYVLALLFIAFFARSSVGSRE